MRETRGFAVVAEIGVNNGSISGITECRDGDYVLVTNCSGDSVSIVDTSSRAVVSTISGIPEPLAVAVGDDRACVSTASSSRDAITVLDLQAETVTAVHPVPFRVTDIAVSPNGKRVYCGATEGARADIAALDTATGEGDIVAISAAPDVTTGSVRISPDGRQLFVAAHAHSSDQLMMMDARRLRVTGAVEIGSPIRDVAVSPDGGAVYVASCSPDFRTVLDVVDTRDGTVTGTAKITGTGGFVTQLALSADGQRAYLVDDHGVTALCARTLDVLGSIDIGSAPSGVAETAGGTRLSVADYAGGVTVVAIPPADTPDFAAATA